MSKIVDLQQWQQENEGNKKDEAKLFLSEAEVRAYPKFKNASIEEVENIIGTLHHLAILSYQLFCEEENSAKAAA